MIELGLGRISALLSSTSLPWRAIHVAGTNGKGSVCAYVSRMLDAYNQSRWRETRRLPCLKHGRFTSPHLIDRWDCITIGQTPVTTATFDRVEARVRARNEDEGIGASEFELLTATAFQTFAEEKVDVAVVEVGMGGRLDATNVIGQRDVSPPEGQPMYVFRPSPLVSVITKIGLDHQAFLGDTLAQIAREKAGIIKPGVPAIYDGTNESVVEGTLQGIAIQAKSPLMSTSSPQIQHLVSLAQAGENHPTTALSSLPPHVQTNVLLAVSATWQALQGLCSESIATADEDHDAIELISAMIRAAATYCFPGRQQRVSVETFTGRHEPILLDGAHNAESAAALAETVDRNVRLGGSGAVTWVLATSDSRDPREIVGQLVRSGDAVFATQFGPVAGMPWVQATASRRVLEAAHDVVQEKVSPWDCGEDVLGALQKASEHAAGGPLVVAGSLYLVGDVLRLLREADDSKAN